MFRWQNLKIKMSNVFNQHISFPGRPLNAASRKSLKIQSPSIAKGGTLSNQKFQ